MFEKYKMFEKYTKLNLSVSINIIFACIIFKLYIMSIMMMYYIAVSGTIDMSITLTSILNAIFIISKAEFMAIFLWTMIPITHNIVVFLRRRFGYLKQQ
jgi:hypothetical protein